MPPSSPWAGSPNAFPSWSAASSIPGTNWPATIAIQQQTVNQAGQAVTLEAKGRHDPWVLLKPSLVREIDIPATGETTPDAAALAAVVDQCARSDVAPTTAGLLQAFAGTEFEGALAAAVASAEEHAITPELAESQLREGVARFREQDEQRRIAALLALPLDQLTPEQRDLIARRLGSGRLANRTTDP